MTDLGDKIKELRAQGYTYDRIQTETGCSRSTISYHLSAGTKGKVRERVSRHRNSNSLIRKTENFKADTRAVSTKEVTTPPAKQRQNKVYKFQDHAPAADQTFTYRDVADKFGPNPVCYITGDPIDLSAPSSYHFDHIVPKKLGGDNSLDNLGLTTRLANQLKNEMTMTELLDMCEKILRNHGRM